MASDARLLEDMGTYKYGFKDSSDDYFFKSQKGLNREIVIKISEMKGEPEWMLEYRLKALDHFLQRPMPDWGADVSGLNLQDIFYYVKPTEGSEKSWDDVPDEIKNTFDKLGIPEAERKFLAGVGAQYITASRITLRKKALSSFPLKMVYASILIYFENTSVRSFRLKTINLPR